MTRFSTAGLIRRILAVILLVSLVVGSGAFFLILRQHAMRSAAFQARLLLDTVLAVSRFTDDEVFPLAGRLSPGGVGPVEFHRQLVPFYAAHAVFQRVHDRYPSFSYRSPAFNPTNPADRATPFEVELTERFRDQGSLRELQGIRTDDGQDFYYFARPIRLTQASCLSCHSTPARAPPGMIAQYGSSNGFGWKLGDTVAIQMLSVPVTEELRGTAELTVTLAAGLLAIFAVTYLALVTVLNAAVGRPLRALALAAEPASRTVDPRIQLPHGGSIEIDGLAGAIERLRRSLAKALAELAARPQSDPSATGPSTAGSSTGDTRR